MIPEGESFRWKQYRAALPSRATAAAWAQAADPISDLEFSHNGLWLAVGLEAGDVQIIDAATATVVATLATSGTVTALSWHPDDTHIAVGGESPEVQALELL